MNPVMAMRRPLVDSIRNIPRDSEHESFNYKSEGWIMGIEAITPKYIMLAGVAVVTALMGIAGTATLDPLDLGKNITVGALLVWIVAKQEQRIQVNVKHNVAMAREQNDIIRGNTKALTELTEVVRAFPRHSPNEESD